MLRKGFLRHKTPENIIRKDVEFSTPFPLFSIGLIYSWRVAPQQSSFTLQSNKAKISNLNYIYNLSKLVTTYHVSKNKYPKKLRRVSVWNEEKNQVIELITNQFNWSPNTISELYKSRWQVEIFFRDIKQLLHIKSFIGTSEKAVMTQIWTALITILILKALKAQSIFEWHLSNLVAFIRLNLFVKIDLQKWLNKPFEEHIDPPPISIQGVLF